MKKIVVSELHQESNSFNSLVTGLEEFEKRNIYTDERMFEVFAKREMGGMLRAIEEGGGKAIPAIAMNSQSGGPVDQTVVDLFLEKTIAVIKRNMPLDGVFLSLHGATQTTKLDDVCGVIIEAVRNEVGGDTVISVSADLHANVTAKWLENADIVCGYQTYPHIDFFDTGYRAGKMGMRCTQGEKLQMARVSIPMIFPASNYSSMNSPFKELLEEAKELVDGEIIDDFSIFQMQPWLDVDPASGAVVLTIGKDSETLKSKTLELAQKLYEMRADFKSNLYSIDEVAEKALNNKSGKPVILVDFADSANAGSTGDSADVLKRLLELREKPKTAMIVNDAQAVELAFKTGVGNSALFSIGGTRNPELFKTVEVEAKVRSLHDGIFCMEGPAGRGVVNDIGQTAVISIGNVDMVLCHTMVYAGDPQIFRHFGVEPTFYQMVVVKACNSFREAYSIFTDEIYLTDTAGAASANLKSLPYKKIPATFYPFSSLDDYQIKL